MSQIIQRQMLPIDTVLDHRYHIVRHLASGGFGNTYLAEDTRLGGQVAIKEFFMRGTNHRSADGTTVELSNDANAPVFESQLKKFQREARRIFELRNDHIIHVSDLFDANGTSYYVMDYIKGTSLAEQTRQQPLPEEEARNVILQVLDALEAMHNAGIYHLDVKPGNIMRDDRGHCTLIDFGASKQLSAVEQRTLSSSTMAYTPGYAPLEQVAQQSKNIGPWTDFFALGATLFRLVTGDIPPEVDSDDIGPDGRQFDYPETTSTTLRHAISTMMNPSRRQRPQNAAEVRTLMEENERPLREQQPQKPKQSEETFLSNPNPSSEISQETKIDESLTSPTCHHRHPIDLGLPSGTRWACCNVGANSPEEYGVFFAWGELETKDEYNKDNYSYKGNWDDSGKNGNNICGTKYDVAHIKWGGFWQMPTLNQIQELLDNCESRWTLVEDVAGMEFTSLINGNSIFLPAAGQRNGSILDNNEKTGNYWSGTMNPPNSDGPKNILHFSEHNLGLDFNIISAGLTVRPVAIIKDGMGYDIKNIMNAAEHGDANAQCNLGECYRYGCGVPKNEDKEIAWYKKAAEQGHPKAQYELGQCYFCGNGVSEDEIQAVEWYRKAAEQGYAEAQCELGRCYEYGWGVTEDKVQAVAWYRKSAEQGYANAQCELGFYYKHGDGVPEDHELAVKWYRKAAEQGDDFALYCLGNCYAEGDGVPQDYEQAVKWYRKAAEQGYDEAQYKLGECYSKGNGVPEDHELAAKWFIKAAEQGNSYKQYLLGKCYYEGDGVPQDYVQAVKWFKEAGDDNDNNSEVDTKIYLGLCYYHGHGVPQDYVQAVNYFSEMANKGDAESQYYLGRCFENGHGVTKDYTQAKIWYRKVAGMAMSLNVEPDSILFKDNDYVSPYFLGLCYYHGLSGRQNHTMAAWNFRGAAEQGNEDAQYYLGLCYENGQGVPRDYGQAKIWYRLAAEKGHVEAKNRLKKLKWNPLAW